MGRETEKGEVDSAEYGLREGLMWQDQGVVFEGAVRREEEKSEVGK